MAKHHKFFGFSSQKDSYNTALYDLELVKADLINHLKTRKGERVMMPNFGTRIYDLLFEPFTKSVENDIISDVKEVVAFEPRVELENIYVVNMEQGIQLILDVNYTPWNVRETLNLVFDRREQEI